MTRRGWLALWALILFGVVLRAWGLDFALPNEGRPDEMALLNAVIQNMGTPLQQGSTALNPGFFYHPSLFLYLLLPPVLCVFFMGAAGLPGIAHYAGWQDFLLAYHAGDPSVYLAARWLSVLAGALAIPATGLLAYHLLASDKPADIARARQTGWISALYATVCYALVRNSHFGVMDMLMATLCTATLALCVRTLQEAPGSSQSRRWALWAAVLTGLSLGTKYFSVTLLAPLLFTLILSRHSFVGIIRAVLVVLIVFAVTSPWVFLSGPEAWSHVVYGLRAMQDNLPLSVPGWRFYPGFALRHGLGELLCLAALAGMVLNVWLGVRKQQTASVSSRSAVLWAFGVAISLPLALSHVGMTRYALPLVPVLLVSAALATEWIATCITDRWPACPKPAMLGLVLAGVLCLQTLWTSLQFDRLMATPDTRNIARAWLISHVPQMQAVATGPRIGKIQLPHAYGQLQLEAALSNLNLQPSDAYQAVDFQSRVIQSYLNMPLLKSWGIQTVVMYQGQPLFANPPRELATYRAAPDRAAEVFRVSPLPDGKPVPGDALFDPLDAFFLPYAGFEGWQRPGPAITIFQLK
ncbi:MAG: glycosyltransferase family 39 protein [Candidatus Melainabacteria bacterium]